MAQEVVHSRERGVVTESMLSATGLHPEPDTTPPPVIDILLVASDHLKQWLPHGVLVRTPIWLSSQIWDMSVTLLTATENTIECYTGFKCFEKLHTLRNSVCFQSVLTVKCNAQSIGCTLSGIACMALRKVSQSDSHRSTQ